MKNISLFRLPVLLGQTFNHRFISYNGKAVLKNITISTRFQNKAVVSGGLTGGEVIITNGFINLFDGANVSVSN
jgi:hypothetical protein